MTNDKYISENKTETFSKGDKVVMHTCHEATLENYKDKVFICQTDSFLAKSKEEVVFLENFSGFFAAQFLKKINSLCIYDFPQKMFSPIGKKSESGKTLWHFEAEKQFPIGWKVADFDKAQKLVEVEDDKGERSWLSLALIFKTIDFTKAVKIRQINDAVISVKFHSVGSLVKRNKESLFLLFESE